MKTLVGYDGDGQKKVPLRPGQAVTIVDGPFRGFEGIIDAVDQDGGKIRVRVSVSGRETLVKFDFPQLDRMV